MSVHHCEHHQIDWEHTTVELLSFFIEGLNHMDHLLVRRLLGSGSILGEVDVVLKVADLSVQVIECHVYAAYRMRTPFGNPVPVRYACG